LSKSFGGLNLLGPVQDFTGFALLLKFFFLIYGKKKILRYVFFFFFFSFRLFFSMCHIHGDRGSTVVKVLRYKSEGLCFDSRWCHGIFH